MTTSKNGKSNNRLVGTSDISKEWLNAIRSAIAACSGNSGYALVNLEIAVNENKVVMYYPTVTKVYPQKIAGVKMTPEAAVALASMMGAGKAD